jgi:hypothetical protein
VTKDGECVIWHDDVILTSTASSCGAHVGKESVIERREVKDLTLDQFKGLVVPSAAVGGKGMDGPVGPPGKAGEGEGLVDSPAADAGGAVFSTDLLRVFRGARSHKELPGPARPWPCCRLDCELPTLGELFEGLPPALGFNLEVKMTLGDDVEHTPEEELLRVVDPIVAEVERHYRPAPAGGVGGTQGPTQRPLAFSSFDPGTRLA